MRTCGMQFGVGWCDAWALSASSPAAYRRSATTRSRHAVQAFCIDGSADGAAGATARACATW